MASKIRSNNDAAVNSADNQGDRNPEQKIKPQQRKPKKWFGFTKTKWREIAGFFVLIPWLYNDLFDSHSFSKLVLLAVSLAMAQGVVFSFFQSHVRGLSLWLISLIPLAMIVYLNAAQQIKAQPKFEFSLCLEDDTNCITLTNDFLAIEKYSDDKPQPFLLDSVLFLPKRPGTSNVLLRVFVKNNSFVDAEAPIVTIGLSTNWNCSMHPDWEPQGTTWGIGTWAYRLPSGWLLQGNRDELPPIKIAQLSTFNDFIIMGRAVGANAQSKGCLIWFSPTDIPYRVEKPFFMHGSNDSRNMLTFPTWQAQNSELTKNGFIVPR